MQEIWNFAHHKVVSWYRQTLPWSSSIQKNTEEKSLFGVKVVAMKQGINVPRTPRCELRMIGIPISGPTYICRDYMSVLNEISRLESVLKKKNNLVCYHAIHESL